MHTGYNIKKSSIYSTETTRIKSGYIKAHISLLEMKIFVFGIDKIDIYFESTLKNSDLYQNTLTRYVSIIRYCSHV